MRRFTCARHFLAYLKAFLPGIEVPTAVLRDPRRARPYVYSEDEILRMQQATRDIWLQGSLQQITLETLIGLLASTGLRIGEALRLTMRDVQISIDPPRLEICNTKFNKSRFVPVHATTAEQLLRYRERRRQLGHRDSGDPFFVFAPGRPLQYEQVLHCFHKVIRRIGIPKRKGRAGPALHSLRHSFAVRRLQAWYHAGLDARALLPHLAIYMGHLAPAQTFTYLTATPDLLAAVSEVFEAHAGAGGNR